MKLKILALAFALVSLVSFTVAEDIKSGLKVGEDIGPFDVNQAGCAEKDGTAAGKQLCYRCKTVRVTSDDLHSFFGREGCRPGQEAGMNRWPRTATSNCARS